MNTNAFASIEELSKQRVMLPCGHEESPYQGIFYHCKHGITMICRKCDRKSAIDATRF